jgi:NAD(P)-dependent dehydrogenase (short-subunit alcohol dehydrogenase family)
MKRKIWVIGNARMSIGEAVVGELMRRTLLEDTDIIGTGTEVDVRYWSKVVDFVSDHGPFTDVVYGAGIPSLQYIKDLNRSVVTALFEINVMGFMAVMHALVNNQEKGNVVALVSDSSHVAMRGSIAYCTSKAALHQAVRVAARELAPDWRVNGVSPSIVAGTRMTDYIDVTVPEFRGWTSEQAKQYEQQSVPMGRRASKSEVADVICDVLFGPEFMTGSIVEMTGGK